MAGIRQAAGARILSGLQHVVACWDPQPQTHEKEENSLDFSRIYFADCFLPVIQPPPSKCSSPFYIYVGNRRLIPLYRRPSQHAALYCARLNVLIVH